MVDHWGLGISCSICHFVFYVFQYGCGAIWLQVHFGFYYSNDNAFGSCPGQEEFMDISRFGYYQYDYQRIWCLVVYPYCINHTNSGVVFTILACQSLIFRIPAINNVESDAFLKGGFDE